MYFDLLINKDFIIIIKGVFKAYECLAISLARRPRAKWIFSPKVNLEVFLCLIKRLIMVT